MTIFKVLAVTVNRPATGRDVDMKTGTFPRIKCVQEHSDIPSIPSELLQIDPFSSRLTG
jgi:hypothetical protein